MLSLFLILVSSPLWWVDFWLCCCHPYTKFLNHQKGESFSSFPAASIKLSLKTDTTDSGIELLSHEYCNNRCRGPNYTLHLSAETCNVNKQSRPFTAVRQSAFYRRVIYSGRQETFIPCIGSHRTINNNLRAAVCRWRPLPISIWLCGAVNHASLRPYNNQKLLYLPASTIDLHYLKLFQETFKASNSFSANNFSNNDGCVFAGRGTLRWNIESPRLRSIQIRVNEAF